MANKDNSSFSAAGCIMVLVYFFLAVAVLGNEGSRQVVFAILLVAFIAGHVWFKVNERNKERKHELALAQAMNAGRIEIIYEDRRGDVSKRRISPIEIKQTDDKRWMITAFCELRHEERTFYADNIVRAIDCESGELITDVVPFIQARCSKQ